MAAWRKTSTMHSVPSPLLPAPGTGLSADSRGTLQQATKPSSLDQLLPADSPPARPPAGDGVPQHERHTLGAYTQALECLRLALVNLLRRSMLVQSRRSTVLASTLMIDPIIQPPSARRPAYSSTPCTRRAWAPGGVVTDTPAASQIPAAPRRWTLVAPFLTSPIYPIQLNTPN